MELTPLHIYLIFITATCIGTAIYIAYLKRHSKEPTTQPQKTSTITENKQIAKLARDYKKLETKLSDLQVAINLQPEKEANKK